MTSIKRSISFGSTLAAPAIVVCAVALGAPVAKSESFFADDWRMTIGAQGLVVPQFEGSSTYRIRPMPIFSIRRANSLSRFKAPDDGLRLGLLEVENVRIGAVGKYRARRAEKDSIDLRGLGNVGHAVELGAFAEIWATQNFRLSAELRHGLGGHTGILADLGADFVMRPDAQLTISAGPRLAWSNAEYNRTYFGVTVGQAAASGLPAYAPEAGVRSLGFVGSAAYAMTPDWSLQAFARYDRLMGDVRDAPLVRQRGSANQFAAGFGLSYSFNLSTR
ncbi:MAG: MipA/OmpV family protein [Salinarimonadaceae bacterium]|nr:MAG: MipA/OmpV family protein [Salinarimonadaceae bacterium]